MEKSRNVKDNIRENILYVINWKVTKVTAD